LTHRKKSAGRDRGFRREVYRGKKTRSIVLAEAVAESFCRSEEKKKSKEKGCRGKACTKSGKDTPH